MLVLVCNVGSTSLKYKLFDMPSPRILAEAKIERVGSPGNGIYAYKNYLSGAETGGENLNVATYTDGINLFLKDLTGRERGAIASVGELGAIGFKTVTAKGYLGVHELTEDVLSAMEEYVEVAPVHTLSYLEAIRKFKAILPDTLMVGVFETDFHRTIPQAARMYGLPYEWYEKFGIERLGFHGASHGYIATQVEQMAGPQFKLISCHLGGSSSICAIRDGKSAETSFGFSLQSGLPHANRVGDLDAYALVYLMKKGFSLDEILNGLYKNGGLLGISGVSNDLRDIETAAKEGNERAKLAIEVLAHEIVKYIGAYIASLGGLDYLVFTAGIGENSVSLREKVCKALSHMGIVLDEERNKTGEKRRKISRDDSPVAVYVIPTNEEVGIARRIYEQFA
ncbi:MAG: acetate/propionate family kinase [Christensenellales bacterium]